MDDDADFSRTTTHTAVKRSGSAIDSPRRKMMMSLTEMEHQQPTGSTHRGAFHARWLIESSVCARVLGPSGKRLKYIKDATREANFQARISPKVQDADYRVFSSYGSAMAIAKVAGLFVRFVYDEPEDQHSHSESYRYDFKLLIPEGFVAALVGVNEENSREIEERSNALLSVEQNCLPYSSERCIHIFGPADAIQIAIYFVLETLKRVENLSGIPIEQTNSKLFNPKMVTVLNFGAGNRSDAIPRIFGPNTTGGTPSSMNEKISMSQNFAATQGSTAPSKLQLPPLQETTDVPQSVYTAYDIARDSRRNHLRQIVQLDSNQKGSAAERGLLIENIRRVTDCNVKEGSNDHTVNFEEDEAMQRVSLVIEGAPQENALALFLIYRFLLRKKETKAPNKSP